MIGAIAAHARLVGVGIGFDLDHTLLIDNQLERVAFLRLLEHIVDRGGKILGTYEDERKRIDLMLERQRAGAFSIEDAVRGFARERYVDDPEPFVTIFTDIAVDLVDPLCIPMPHAKQVLRDLVRRGATIAILSNGWNPLQERKARRVGFEGPVLSSASLGALKPDPRTFALLAKALGLLVGKIWYVGDDPRVDIAGALAAGMHAVWYRSEPHTYPKGAPPPTRTIASLEELAESIATATHGVPNAEPATGA